MNGPGRGQNLKGVKEKEKSKQEKGMFKRRKKEHMVGIDGQREFITQNRKKVISERSSSQSEKDKGGGKEPGKP